MNELHRIWAENIRVARKAFGLSQAQFAEMVGVTQQTVSEWEQADDGQRSTPRDDMKIRIAEVLHQDVRMMFPLVRVGAGAR